MSIRVEQAPDTVQDPHEAFHVTRQPAADVLALEAAPTESDPPADARGQLEQAEWTAGSIHIHAFMPAPQRTGRPYGTVTVPSLQRGNVLMRTVTDNGPGFGGIPGSAGLGLPAMARAVVRHGGRTECGGSTARCIAGRT